MKYTEYIKKMTLEEKCSLLSGANNFDTRAIKRLNIPFMTMADGPSGLRKQEGRSDQLGLNASVPAVCFPSSATMANAWDTELMERLGEKLGEEARAMGVNVLLGPGLNIKRSPLCGRNFEYFSEDPFLAGKLAAHYIQGVQSQGVSACPKHFAVNSQEHLRMNCDSVLDDRTLREMYLTGFEIAVKEGHPRSIMSAYNRINGVYANEDKRLLRDILVGEWGFEGFVVTDWGGSNDRVAGLVAGNQVEMPGSQGISDIEVVRAVREGRLDESIVEERVEEYLKVLFDTVIPDGAPATFDQQGHHAFAREAAQKAIVLLKNEHNILPIPAATGVAVVGDLAETVRFQGTGSSCVNPTQVDNPLDALRQSGLTITGYASGYRRDGNEDEALKNAALALAAEAKTVLLYMGLTERYETEGLDRTHMKLPSNQESLLRALSAVTDRIIVVLCGGAPFEMPWAENCAAIVHGYLGGQAGAGAMADVLAGRVNPCGKLAETWPVAYEDTPSHRYYPGMERTAEYREAGYIGYRYYQKTKIPVRFAFGYGLSYTAYRYDGLLADEKQVSFTLTNTGDKQGSEIAQVYIACVQSGLFRAERELKGFIKVCLEPGESKRVTVPLDEMAFRYFNTVTGAWEIEGGEYEIGVGASSEDIRVRAAIRVEGTDAPNPYDPAKLSSYYAGKVSAVSDAEFEALLGRPVPEAKWDRSKPLERNDSIAQLVYAKRWVGRFVGSILTRMKMRSEKKGKPDLNILFIYNLPFRGIAKMMGGAVDLSMVDCMLEIVNGHFFRGLYHLVKAFNQKNRAIKAMKEALKG